MNLSCDNPPVTFKVTSAAMSQLYKDAARAGEGRNRMFRLKANYLARSLSEPKFHHTERETRRAFITTNLHPKVYSALVKLARRFNLPATLIGQMVCTYDYDRSGQ